MRSVSKIFIGIGLVLLILSIGCANKAIKQSTPPEEKAADSSQFIIGSEDVLDIHVWGEQALSAKVTVRADGKISLPLIHDVQAAGLAPLQLQESLNDKLKEFVDGPNVSVTVLEANSFKVYISGQVKSPGVYRLRAETTLVQFIIMAGGFTDWAKRKKILIIRKEGGEEKRIIANYNKMIDGKAPELVLKREDNIIVP